MRANTSASPEQLTLDQRVQGSSPCAPTKLKSQKKIIVDAGSKFLAKWRSGQRRVSTSCKIKSASRIHNEVIQATPDSVGLIPTSSWSG
jgi:hypothetical protein